MGHGCEVTFSEVELVVVKSTLDFGEKPVLPSDDDMGLAHTTNGRVMFQVASLIAVVCDDVVQGVFPDPIGLDKSRKMNVLS